MTTAGSRTVVDCHCHASPVWYEPFEMLRLQMERCGIARAVVVQIHGQFDNSYLQACVGTDPGRYVAVACVDVGSDGVADRLRRVAAEGAVGVRLRIRDGIGDPDPLGIWKAACDLNLTVSVSGRPAGQGDVERIEYIAKKLPELTLVIEHLGGGGVPKPQGESLDERRAIYELSECHNVYMKFGGLGEVAHRAKRFSDGRRFAADIPPFHMMAYRAFGADRMMWGSSYPAVSNREGYAGALESAFQAFQELPARDIDLMFGGTAMALYFNR